MNRPEIITELYRKDLPLGYPSIWIAHDQDKTILGRGCAWDDKEARTKAIMEFVERYCYRQPLSGSIRWGAADDFERPRGYCGTGTTLRWWCEALNLRTSETVLFPLEYSQLSSLCTINSPIVKRDSSGFAAHFKKDSAIQNGINEVLERAGIYNLWENPVAQHYKASGVSPETDAFLQIFDENGYEAIILLNEPTPGFTASCAILRQYAHINGGPALVVGCGGNTSKTLSINKAMTEAYGQLVNAVELGSERENIVDADMPALFYLCPNNADKLIETWLDGSVETHVSQDQNRAITLDAYMIDRFNPFTISLGVEVVQIIIPDLQCLDISSRGFCNMPSPFY